MKYILNNDFLIPDTAFHNPLWNQITGRSTSIWRKWNKRSLHTPDHFYIYLLLYYC